MPLLGSRGAASTTGFGALANLGYFLRNSLRFRASNSAFLSRTPASTTNQRTFTWSGWVKRGLLGASEAQFLFSARSANDDSGWFSFFFNTNDTLGVGGWSLNYRITSQLFRDPSAWYHLVLAVDTTQATASNRVRVYVNGSEVTAFSTTNNPTQNFDYPVNSSAAAHSHGSVVGYASTYYFDGYMAEVNFVDGQQLTPSSFGKTDAATNQWVPKKFGGAYGTNGFYLKFDDSSAVGKDSSGNGNNWSTSGHSVTPGTTYDLMTDVPTLTNATTANYATLNPLAMYGSNMLISNAGLTSSATSTSNDRGWSSTIAAPGSGKWYAEFTFTATNGDNNGGCGIMLENGTGVPGDSATTVSWRDAGTLRQNSSGTSYGSALTANDIVMVAYDAALGRVWFGKNGTWFSSGDPANNANPSATGITSSGRFATYHYNTVAGIHANFGQRPFSYTAPSGFKALNTFNLP